MKLARTRIYKFANAVEIFLDVSCCSGKASSNTGFHCVFYRIVSVLKVILHFVDRHIEIVRHQYIFSSRGISVDELEVDDEARLRGKQKAKELIQGVVRQVMATPDVSMSGT